MAADTREGLCARCWARVTADLAALAVPGPVAGPIRERTVGHRVYVVVWDGSKR